MRTLPARASLAVACGVLLAGCTSAEGYGYDADRLVASDGFNAQSGDCYYKSHNPSVLFDILSNATRGETPVTVRLYVEGHAVVEATAVHCIGIYFPAPADYQVSAMSGSGDCWWAHYTSGHVGARETKVIGLNLEWTCAEYTTLSA